MRSLKINKVKSIFLLGLMLLFFCETRVHGQTFVLHILDWASGGKYSSQANYWYQQSGIGFKTVPGHCTWNDVYKKADFSIDFDENDFSAKPISACVLQNTVAIPRLLPIANLVRFRGECPAQFINNQDGTYTLTDTSLTFSKYLDLWVENFAKPAIEYYASQGCYIIDFGSESWPVHYWDANNGVLPMANVKFAGDAWYPFDNLSDTPEITDITGESTLSDLLNSQYNILDYSDDELLKTSFLQTLQGLRGTTPPDIPAANQQALADIFSIAGQIRIKDDYVAGKIQYAFQKLYEWKMQYYPKMVIAFSTHGNLMATMPYHAGEIKYVDWFGPDNTPGGANENDTSEFEDVIYGPLSDVIEDASNKIWGMGSFETAVRPDDGFYGVYPYNNSGLTEYGELSYDVWRCNTPTMQTLFDRFYEIDGTNKYIKCYIINRPFQAKKYSDISADDPSDIGGSFGKQSYLAPYTFVDSDEPLGTTITPRAGVQDPLLALWDGDGDGSYTDTGDPLFEIRGFANRWGAGNPALDGNGDPLPGVWSQEKQRYLYQTKYSYVYYNMFDPSGEGYSYWRNAYPLIPNWKASKYDYTTQKLTLSLKNTAGPDSMSTDCLVFQRQTFSPPWSTTGKAKPETLYASLPTPSFSISENSYSVSGKTFNSSVQPTEEIEVNNFYSTNGLYCFVYLKDKPGVKGLAGVNQISTFSSYALERTSCFKGYLDARDIISANTEDTIQVRIIAKDAQGFETTSPILTKDASLVYGGMDFIPISYEVSDAEGIVDEKIEYKRDGDSEWTSINRKELIIPVQLPAFTPSQILVDADNPFAPSSGSVFGLWAYHPGTSIEANQLQKGATYRLHMVAHSPDSGVVSAQVSGYNSSWQLLHTVNTGLSSITLTSQAQEYVSPEFIYSYSDTVYDLIYFIRSSGTLIIDKAWLETVDRTGNEQIVVPYDYPFEAASGYCFSFLQYNNPDSLTWGELLDDNLLAKNMAYRLHAIAHSPDSGSLSVIAQGFDESWSQTEQVNMGLNSISLGTQAQEYISNDFIMSAPLTIYPLVYLYRIGNTICVDEAWLEPRDVYKNNSLYQLPICTSMDPNYIYRLHVIASSPDGAKFGATALGYDSEGQNIETKPNLFWDLTLTSEPQEYVSEAFYMADIGVTEGKVFTYRSNQTGTLVIEKAWLSVDGPKPEVIILVSPETGLINNSSYYFNPCKFDAAKQYQFYVVAQSADGSTLGVLANGYNADLSALIESNSIGIWNVSLTSSPQMFVSSVFYLHNASSVNGLLPFYRCNQTGTLEIKRAWLVPMGDRP